MVPAFGEEGEQTPQSQDTEIQVKPTAQDEGQRHYLIDGDPEEPAKKEDAPKAEEKPAKSKAEEVKELLKFGKKKPKTEEPAKEEAPAAEEEEKPADKPKRAAKPKVVSEDEEEPAAPKERARPRFRTEEIERVAEAAARGAVAARAEAETPKADETAEIEATLDSRDSELLAMYRELEQANPRFKGQSQKFLKFVPAAKAYESSWRRRHPGEEFNPDDAEHADFYAKNEPLQLTESDESSAKRQLAKRQTREEVDAVLAEREKEIEKKVEWRFKRREAVAVESNEAVQALVEEVDPEISEKLSTFKTKEELEAFAEEDPAAFEVLDQVAAQTRTLVGALVEAERHDGGLDLDSRNPAHRQLSSILGAREDFVQSLPKAKQLFDGKLFATHEQWERMGPKERARHWIIDGFLLKRELLKEMAAVAKEQLKVERRKVERYRGGGRGNASAVTRKAEPAEEPKPATKADKPRSPESRASGGSVNSDGSKLGSVDPKVQQVKSMLWGD